MPTNFYFNNFKGRGEQSLLEDIIVESIKIMGFDGYYLGNQNDSKRDLLYGDDPLKAFKTSYPIEMYLSSTMDYGGDKEFFSKFQLEIRNTITVMISKRSFNQIIPSSVYARPREGDLIYVPILNGTGELFEIKFVNQNKDFALLGRKTPYFYELELEKFKYSHEVISTGITEIDQVVTDSSYTIYLNTGSGTGTYALKEYVYQSTDGTFANSTCSGTVQSWTASSSLLSITNIRGLFIANKTIIGQTSNAQYTLITFDPLQTPAAKESYDTNLYPTKLQLLSIRPRKIHLEVYNNVNSL